jgi:drug/metabolite transporter (DMT)-like permease
MQRALSILRYILPGIVAAVFSLYLVLRPKGYEQAYELGGLLLISCLVLVSLVEGWRRSASLPRKRSRYGVIAGPLLLVLAILWILLASRLHFQLALAGVIFLLLLGTGAAIVGYGIYSSLKGR